MSPIAERYTADMLTFGESYMDGLWDVPDLEQTLFEMMRDKTLHRMAVRRVEDGRSSIEAHYDLGNDLYQAMLGPSLCYSAGRWDFARDLETAQTHKLAVVAEKLQLEPGMTVLDLGCGWGAFGRYCRDAGLGVEVTGLTLSAEQARIAGRFGPVQLRDYRAAEGRYDRVVSLGMLEHVGPAHYRDYFQTVARCLEPDGVHLFECSAHTASHRSFNPWIKRYIFPDGVLPSLAQLAKASERIFTLEDVENFGLDYVPTCRAWWANCERARARLTRYDARFWRMWKFYLLGSAAAFRSRDFQHYQVVATKGRLKPPPRVQAHVWRGAKGRSWAGMFETA